MVYFRQRQYEQVSGIRGRRAKSIEHGAWSKEHGGKMENHQLREKVAKEISQIPIEKLNEVYDFIRFFRLEIEKVKPNKDKILSFAGCWEDMPDETFNDFLSEIRRRRKEAFSGRKMDEISIG